MLRSAIAIATVGAIIMIVLAELSWHGVSDVAAEQQTLQATRATIDAITNELLVAKSSEHSLLATGDAGFMKTYKQARAQIQHQRELLRRAPPVSMKHTGDIQQFDKKVEDTLHEMDRTIDLSKSQGTPNIVTPTAAKPRTDRGGAFLHPDNRTSTRHLTHTIDARISARRTQLDHRLNASRIILLAGILLAWLAFVWYARQRQSQQDASSHRGTLLKRRGDRWAALAHGRADQLAELATYLQTAAEDERTRLAHELHDEFGALMTAAKLDIARLKPRIPAEADDAQERLTHLNGLLNESITLGRRITENLHPSSLTNLGLVATLEILASEWRASSGIEVQTTLETVRLDDMRELTIYRLVQEALTNISKHAQATHVSVNLKNLDDRVEVTVVDDGMGFDVKDMSIRSRGLAGMRHRLEACGGSFEIVSRRGRGTRVIGKILNHGM